MNVEDFAFAIIIGTERMISKLRQGNQKAIRAFLGVVLDGISMQLKDHSHQKFERVADRTQTCD